MEYEEKGITNSGREADYEGCVFSDGTVVIRWLTEYRSHSVWACWDDFYQVHGHPEYGTSIRFDNGMVVDAEHPYNPLYGLPEFGPGCPISPVPVDYDPDGERPPPRRWQYPIGGPWVLQKCPHCQQDQPSVERHGRPTCAYCGWPRVKDAAIGDAR